MLKGLMGAWWRRGPELLRAKESRPNQGDFPNFSLFLESRNSRKRRVATSTLNYELLRRNLHFSPTCGATTWGNEKMGGAAV